MGEFSDHISDGLCVYRDWLFGIGFDIQPDSRGNHHDNCFGDHVFFGLCDDHLG